MKHLLLIMAMIALVGYISSGSTSSGRSDIMISKNEISHGAGK